MDEVKQYNLEERTFEFAKRIRKLVKNLPRTYGNIEDIPQLVRSSGSVGANYIEANESLGKKDFLMRIKICRKEAKECCYWLRLIEISEKDEQMNVWDSALEEATELMKIFGAIYRKSE